MFVSLANVEHTYLFMYPSLVNVKCTNASLAKYVVLCTKKNIIYKTIQAAFKKIFFGVPPFGYLYFCYFCACNSQHPLHPSSIWCRGSKPRRPDHESSALTTRPWLSPIQATFAKLAKLAKLTKFTKIIKLVIAQVQNFEIFAKLALPQMSSPKEISYTCICTSTHQLQNCSSNLHSQNLRTSFHCLIIKPD